MVLHERLGWPSLEYYPSGRLGKKQLAKSTLTHGFFPFETSPLCQCWRILLISSQTCSGFRQLCRHCFLRHSRTQQQRARFYCRSREAEHFSLVSESMNFSRIVLRPPAKCVPRYRELLPATGPSPWRIVIPKKWVINTIYARRDFFSRCPRATIYRRDGSPLGAYSRFPVPTTQRLRRSTATRDEPGIKTIEMNTVKKLNGEHRIISGYFGCGRNKYQCLHSK